MMTVRELLAALDGVEPNTWVCVVGVGPAIRVTKELGANKPFVVIESQEEEKTAV